MLPFEDPTNPSPIGGMSVEQYATAVAVTEDYQSVQDRRKKTDNPRNDRDGAAKATGGRKWVQLTPAQQAALEEFRQEQKAAEELKEKK